MNELLEKLVGGDLRSDGRANEVADEAIKSPRLMSKLVEGISESDEVVRARAAHALEKVSRTNPEMLQKLIPRLIKLAAKDNVPMVKWHLAMLFGNITLSGEETDVVISALFHLLKDESVFVKSWSIASLTVIGRRNKVKRKKIINKLKALEEDESIAVRVRVRRALTVLKNENEPLPASWSKAKD